MDFKEKVLSVIKNDKHFKNNDIHQCLMNLGYKEWQKEENNWSYTEMLNWTEENYGKLVKFAILIGKYNEQVENGGHYQYVSNNYTGDLTDWSSVPEIPLHKEMIGLMQSFGLDKSEIGKKVFDIIWNFKPELNTAENIEKEYYDEETGEVYYEEKENQDYGTIDNIYDLDELDLRYYEVNDEWIKFLNDFFTKELINTPSAYNVVESIETKKIVKKPRVKLVGIDGNAYNIMALVRKALRDAGLGDQVDEFIEEATSGDYNHLLQVCSKYVEVE